MHAHGSQDPAIYAAPLAEQLESFLDDHRQALYDHLDDLTEEEARLRLVPSKTTLLGLVKHATFVELVWFNEAITGRSRVEIGCAAGPDESFQLDPSDPSSPCEPTTNRSAKPLAPPRPR